MRLRRHRARSVKVVNDEASDKKVEHIESEQVNHIKDAKPGLIRRIINNPNIAFQLMVIIVTLASDNMRMDRRIDNMTSTIDTVKNITEVINNTMRSIKVASEAPKHIRNLLQ